MKTRTIVIDDEPLARDRLLKRWSGRCQVMQKVRRFVSHKVGVDS